MAKQADSNQSVSMRKPRREGRQWGRQWLFLCLTSRCLCPPPSLPHQIEPRLSFIWGHDHLLSCMSLIKSLLVLNIMYMGRNSCMRHFSFELPSVSLFLSMLHLSSSNSLFIIFPSVKPVSLFFCFTCYFYFIFCLHVCTFQVSLLLRFSSVCVSGSELGSHVQALLSCGVTFVPLNLLLLSVSIIHAACITTFPNLRARLREGKMRGRA